MRRFLSAAVLVGLALTATAASAADKKPPPVPGTSVSMPILVAPMIVEGKLHAYAYISCTVVATSPSAAIKVRLKTPFIQDAFVRDVNGETIVKPGTTDALDADRLKSRMLADVRHVVGAEKVDTLTFTQVQITPLAPDRVP